MLTNLKALTPSDVKRTQFQVQELASGTFQYTSRGSITLDTPEVIQDAQQLLANRAQNVQVLAVQYLPDNPEEVGASLREKAIANARDKAEQIAKASGGRVGRVISVSETGNTSETGSSVTSELAGIGNQVQSSAQLTVTFALR